MVGITGGIGSGKSVISNALREKGYRVYDCDSEAKRLVAAQPAIHAQQQVIINSVPNVFEHPNKIAALNALIHPLVKADIQEKQPQFVESAILYESGLADWCDCVIAVIAPKNVRIERVMKRDNCTAEAVKARIKQQTSNCQLRKMVHYVVENNGRNSIDDLTSKLCHFLTRRGFLP